MHDQKLIIIRKKNSLEKKNFRPPTTPQIHHFI